MGSEGSGKTNFLGGMLSGALKPDNTAVDTLGTFIQSNEGEKAILLYDSDLGSEVQRKAAGILLVEKETNTNYSVVKALKVRDGSPLDVPLIQFGWDKAQGRHVYLGNKSKEESESRKINELSEVAREIFAKKSVLGYSELLNAVMEALDIKDRMARNYIKFMKDNGIIEKSNGITVEYSFPT